MFNFIKQLSEGKVPKTLEQVPLPYSRTDLVPVTSKETLDYHYGELYKAYVKRFNAGEGDLDFNEAGAFLHAIYFQQFRLPKDSNTITGPIEAFIKKYFKSFDNFKEQFLKTAMAIQGSGWVYLSTDGKIKTITNHEIKNDILILVDWWEHAFMMDFGTDKKTYLKNQWKIMNWDYINSKLEK